MSRARSTTESSIHLEIPRRSTDLEDPGAHDLSSEDEFQDATEGSAGRRKASRPVTPSSPVPITRVEKVDDDPSYGEVPGTPAYDKRKQDAVPDEVEVVPEGKLSKRNSRQFLDTPLSPGGTSVPKTVVEKVDPSSPSYGEEPGTPAYRKRMADAVPDLTLKNANPDKDTKYKEGSHSRSASTMSIPETIVTKADDEPAYGEVSGTKAAEMRKRDPTPDRVEIKRDESDDPQDENDDNAFDENNDDGFGDDFDDFEEGAQAGADDDFGGFDDFEQGVQENTDPQAHQQHQPQPQPAEPQTPIQSFPLIDFEALSSLPDLLETTKIHLDAMFPTTAATDQQTTTSPSGSIPSDSPIFPTERSRSLWKQFITPPPLQPPNWTQSRIRRLFLISLGVPVDLDEILPPSKQKKLILLDTTLSSRNSTATNPDASNSQRPENENISKLKSSAANDSTASLDSQQSIPGATLSKDKRGRERPKSMKPSGPAPPPALDLNEVKRMCATTEEKLDGFTDDELQAHVKGLEALTERTSQVLEYWLKRRDGLRKEKEAFEGVIENLVRHAKRVRTIK